ncbi:MFS general substrate transporter [Wolfiporia cocos MD-104 SS10]|uniref:MFS general substrate transporter n=1 Tax=Wolfiporia cocos (strain MD-104) TaxID=742152 RepID=A0A2H3J8F9_WOLCO|nr:MFS general substrate transporter [Wolfiporia cocos MD-104 SS10]
MSSEESPLLRAAEPIRDEEDRVYDRFTSRQKRVIVAVVSWTGLIPLFVSSSFVPAIPQVAHDLGTTGSVINLSVSLSMVTASVSSLIWAKYSSYYGRRPIYLASLPCLCAGALGVALSRSVLSLILFQTLQAFGYASGISVGAGVVGDICRVEERGSAIGIFFGASLLGAALAPLTGGTVTHYISWRAMPCILCLAGLVALLLTALYLPETSHPGKRGVDKLLSEDSSDAQRWRWVWLNPFSSLKLLQSPNLMLMTLMTSCVLLTDFVLLIPLSYTIGARYHIKNEALVGAFFIAAGVGNITGAPLAGRISDHVVVKWRLRRHGEWVPEDRLRATLLPAATLVPLSVLLSGLTTQFIEGKPGIVLNVICLFMNGIGVDMTLSPVNAYLVDAMHTRSAEIIAAQKGVRNLLVAMATAGILPLINHIGVASTNAISAAIAWIGFFLLWLTVHYGSRMRAWSSQSDIDV